jgi:hypothetical protein
VYDCCSTHGDITDFCVSSRAGSDKNGRLLPSYTGWEVRLHCVRAFLFLVWMAGLCTSVSEIHLFEMRGVFKHCELVICRSYLYDVAPR